MRKRFLITGGTGKTGRHTIAALVQAGHECIVATRSGRGLHGQPGLRFDWGETPLSAEIFDGIDGIYLVAPSLESAPLQVMAPWIDAAQTQGPLRFVLLSASSLEEGAPMMGEVHQYLKATADDWAVLRPTWFMQNFSEQQHLPTLREEDAVYSATNEGQIPFIDARDIGAVAAELLMGEEAPNRDLLLTGPELLRYDDVAAIIRQELSRPIRHIKLSPQELAQRHQDSGLTEIYAELLAAMDKAIAEGAEARLSSEVAQIVGRPPRDFRSFVKEHKTSWL